MKNILKKRKRKLYQIRKETKLNYTQFNINKNNLNLENKLYSQEFEEKYKEDKSYNLIFGTLLLLSVPLATIYMAKKIKSIFKGPEIAAAIVLSSMVLESAFIGQYGTEKNIEQTYNITPKTHISQKENLPNTKNNFIKCALSNLCVYKSVINDISNYFNK